LAPIFCPSIGLVRLLVLLYRSVINFTNRILPNVLYRSVINFTTRILLTINTIEII